jgi:hypothetical protein
MVHAHDTQSSSHCFGGRRCCRIGEPQSALLESVNSTGPISKRPAGRPAAPVMVEHHALHETPGGMQADADEACTDRTTHLRGLSRRRNPLCKRMQSSSALDMDRLQVQSLACQWELSAGGSWRVQLEQSSPRRPLATAVAPAGSECQGCQGCRLLLSGR